MRAGPFYLLVFVLTVVVPQTSAPTLTEVDQLRIERVNLLQQLTTALQEADTCRGQLAEPRARANRLLVSEELAKLKATLERAHPGFVWDPPTGTWTPAKE